MNLEPLARYIDAIAPAGGAHVAGDVRPDRRRSTRAVVAACAAVLALAVVTASITGSDPSGTTSSPVESIDPGLVVPAPGGPSVVIRLAGGLTLDRADVLVTHQVGSVIDGYGYDATIYESVPVPFDPCPDSQPCTEVAEPATNAAGLVVRYWAPTLVPGARPTSASVVTVEAPGGAAVLALLADHAGGPLSGDEVASALSHDGEPQGPGTFAVTLGGQVHPFTWVGTMVRPEAPDTAPWILLVSPGCEGADRCESGVGLSSLAPPSGGRQPIDELVASVTVHD